MLPTTLWFEDLVGDATPARAPREEALREIHLPHRLIPNTVVSSEAGRSLSSGVKVAPLDDDADEDLGLRVDEGCEYRSSQMRPYRDVHEDLAPHRRHQTESSRSSAGEDRRGFRLDRKMRSSGDGPFGEGCPMMLTSTCSIGSSPARAMLRRSPPTAHRLQLDRYLRCPLEKRLSSVRSSTAFPYLRGRRVTEGGASP